MSCTLLFSFQNAGSNTPKLISWLTNKLWSIVWKATPQTLHCRFMMGHCCSLLSSRSVMSGSSVTPMDYITWQTFLSMEFPRQGYWSGLPFPSPGDLHLQGIEPEPPALTGKTLYHWATREAWMWTPGLRNLPFTLILRFAERRQGVAWGAGPVFLDELSRKSFKDGWESPTWSYKGSSALLPTLGIDASFSLSTPKPREVREKFRSQGKERRSRCLVFKTPHNYFWNSFCIRLKAGGRRWDNGKSCQTDSLSQRTGLGIPFHRLCWEQSLQVIMSLCKYIWFS